MTTIADLVARTDYIRRAHVTEPGFRFLYVRVRSGAFPVIVLADMTSHEPGSGALTALLARLATDHPDHAVTVENVSSERLARYLERHGFEACEPPGSWPWPTNWYRPPATREAEP